MFSDLRFAVRMLGKNPGFTIIALLTLALGIGANTAIFSLIKSVLLQPPPYPQPEQLVSIWEKQPSYAVAPTSWPNLHDYQRENRTFSALAGYRIGNFTLSGNGEPEMLSIAQVTASYFDVLGLPAQVGRVFTADEDKPGKPGLVLLSDAFWRRHFAGNRDVIGRSVTLNNQAFTVIGVLPPEFVTPAGIDAVTQISGSYWSGWDARGNRHITMLGRLKRGVTLDAAIADLKRIAAQIEQNDPQTSAGVTAMAKPSLEQLVGGYREGLWLLLGAVGLVLLIACANLANLLLARGAVRAPEIAARAALGASRGRLIRQLLAETALLGLGGGILGVVVAAWAHTGIASLSPAGATRFQAARIDNEILAATAVLSLLTVLAFGLWPAWRVSKTDLRSALQAGGRTSSAGRGTARAREMLIVGEVALTLVLLFGASVLLRSFARARALDLGFDPHGVLTARVSLPWRGYETPEKRQAFQNSLLANLAAQPDVQSAALATVPPLSAANVSWQNSYLIEGEPAPEPAQTPLAEFNAISDEYFRTVGVALLRGRNFAATDIGTTEGVAIVDRAFAERHWPGRDALGKRILLGPQDTNGLRIIGIVPTLHLYGYSAEPRLPQVYVCLRQNSQSNFSVLVRSKGGSAAAAGRLESALRDAVRAADPTQTAYNVRTFENIVGATLGTPRLYTFLLAIFAGLAVLLAAVGFYGVLAYQVAQRTREFGIRLALGALRSQLLMLVLGRGLRLFAIGSALGLVAALALGRVLASLLYHTSALDPVVLATVTLALGGVTLLACWLPARRATRVDPLTALRTE